MSTIPATPIPGTSTPTTKAKPAVPPAFDFHSILGEAKNSLSSLQNGLSGLFSDNSDTSLDTNADPSNPTSGLDSLGNPLSDPATTDASSGNITSVAQMQIAMALGKMNGTNGPTGATGTTGGTGTAGTDAASGTGGTADTSGKNYFFLGINICQIMADTKDPAKKSSLDIKMVQVVHALFNTAVKDEDPDSVSYLHALSIKMDKSSESFQCIMQGFTQIKNYSDSSEPGMAGMNRVMKLLKDRLAKIFSPSQDEEETDQTDPNATEETSETSTTTPSTDTTTPSTTTATTTDTTASTSSDSSSDNSGGSTN